MKSFFRLSIVIISLFCVLFAFASCGDSGKINGAIKQTKALTNVDADVYIDMNINAGNNVRHFTEVKHILSTEGEKVLTQETGRAFGEDEGKVTYYDGEYAYLPDGTKQKTSEYKKYNTDYVELMDQLLGFIPDWLVEKDENGNRLATITDIGGVLDVSIKVQSNDSANAAKQKREALNDLLSLLTSSTIQRVERYLFCSDCQETKYMCDECGDKEFENCPACTTEMSLCKKCKIESIEVEANSLDLRIEDGYVTEYAVNYGMYFKTGMEKNDKEPIKILIDGRIKVVINNPGKTFKIEIPKDSKDFAETTVTKRPTLYDLVK